MNLIQVFPVIMQLLMRISIRHIHHGKPLQSDAREVVGVIRLIEAAWESSRMQCVVRI